MDIALTTKNQDGQTVLTKQPDADAYTNTYAQRALNALKTAGVHVTGANVKPITGTLNEGGS